jgi:predicted ATP-grasp superfamily ATP-dependent carboligase
MTPLIWDHRPSGLRAPAMICAFQGWNDAGDCASGALAFLRSALECRRFAYLDSEEFFDFQSNRPCIRVDEHGARELVWPTVEVFEAHAPRASRDLVLVQGAEPSMRWRAFSSHLIDLAEALGVQVMVSLGGHLGDVAHSRPVTISGFASEPTLIERIGMTASRYEGPTGIVGALHASCMEARLPAVSMWAAVPHYVAAASNPKAALALVRHVESLVGVSIDVTELEEAAGEYERQVTLAVQGDPDVQAFVERLEQEADSEQELSPRPVPSGDMLEREFQRFLKQRGIR